MSIEITEALISHIATLARLGLSESEIAEIQGHFEKVLHYVEALDKLDTESVDPSIFTNDAINMLEQDSPHAPLGQELALKNGPEVDEDSFLVPRIIAEAGNEAGGGKASP